MAPFGYPLVRIRWVDSTSPRLGWIRLAEWEGVGSLECVSVGFVIAEDDRSKTVVPHLAYPDDPEQCQGSGIIVIPLPAILSVENLSSSNSADLRATSACAGRDRSFDRPESEPPSGGHPGQLQSGDS